MYRLLVTGVGALIGCGIVRSLNDSRFETTVYGMDIQHDAVGRKWCDHFIEALPLSSPDYIGFLRNIITEYSIDLVIPGFEADTMRIHRSRAELGETCAGLVLNNSELLDIANDKWLTQKTLAENGFPAIPGSTGDSFDSVANKLGIPFIVKPRRSHASIGVCEVSQEYEYIYRQKKLGDNFLAQKIIGTEDEEYTAGVFGYGDGTGSKAIVFQRKLGGGGATVSARSVVIPSLNKFIVELVALFRPEGPTNFQFRKHDGVFYLLEVNARISSTTSIRTAFGFNEAEMCIRYYLLNEKPDPVTIMTGTALRYLEDIIVYDRNHIRHSR